MMTTDRAEAEAQRDAKPIPVRRTFLPPRTCEHCGQSFRQNKDENCGRFVRRRYCSMTCYQEARRAQALQRVAGVDELTMLREKLEWSQHGHRIAAQRAERAERALSQLKRELASTGPTASYSVFPDEPSATAESEPTSIYDLQYPELMRAARIIRHLLTANDGRDAAVANRMLTMIAEMCRAVDGSSERRRVA